MLWKCALKLRFNCLCVHSIYKVGFYERWFRKPVHFNASNKLEVVPSLNIDKFLAQWLCFIQMYLCVYVSMFWVLTETPCFEFYSCTFDAIVHKRSILTQASQAFSSNPEKYSETMCVPKKINTKKWKSWTEWTKELCSCVVKRCVPSTCENRNIPKYFQFLTCDIFTHSDVAEWSDSLELCAKHLYELKMISFKNEVNSETIKNSFTMPNFISSRKYACNCSY